MRFNDKELEAWASTGLKTLSEGKYFCVIKASLLEHARNPKTRVVANTAVSRAKMRKRVENAIKCLPGVS